MGRLFEATRDAVIVADVHTGRIVLWNPAATDTFGYSLSEALGLNVEALVPDRLKARYRMGLVRYRETGHGRYVDSRELLKPPAVRKDGEEIRVEMSLSPLELADSSGTGRRFALAIVRDVTELARAEEESRRLRENLEERVQERTAPLEAALAEHGRAAESSRFMAEASTMLASSLDYRNTLSNVARLAVPTLADWCAVDVLLEDGSVERLAVEHEDRRKVALALKLQERYPSDPNARGGLPNVLRTGGSERYPRITDEMLRSAARDEEHLGLLRELGFTSVMIVPMIARGRTLGAITLVSAESGRGYGEADLHLTEELARRAALAVDNARLFEEAQKEIAERRRTQEELRDSRDQLEIILRGVADGITAQEPTGRLIYANEAAARMVGYPSARAFMEAPPGEVMRRFEVLDEEGRPFPLERLPGRRALLGEDAEEVLRFRVIETGEERWSVVRATPIFGERKTVRMAVNIFRDITGRKRAEEALQEMRESERRRIAHDLHDGVLQDLSYTAASMGLILLKAEGTHLEDEVQRSIDAVRHAAQGLRDAVNDLRLEEASDRPLPELVESLVKRGRAMARGGQQISLEVGEGFPIRPLRETGTQLSRIIQEALTNARRHSGARNVLVSLRIERGELVSEISDDGRGLVAGAAPGVGLKSMQERVQALNGTLNIESEPNKGTRVRIRVPMP